MKLASRREGGGGGKRLTKDLTEGHRPEGCAVQGSGGKSWVEVDRERKGEGHL